MTVVIFPDLALALKSPEGAAQQNRKELKTPPSAAGDRDMAKNKLVGFLMTHFTFVVMLPVCSWLI